MAFLKFQLDDGRPSQVPIDAEHPIVKIGRSKECSVRTRNSTVSRRHSQVVFTGSEFKVYDLGSSNGTFYDRKRVKEHTLVPGDVFFCGNFRVEFEVPEPQEPDILEEVEFGAAAQEAPAQEVPAQGASLPSFEEVSSEYAAAEAEVPVGQVRPLTPGPDALGAARKKVLGVAG